MLNEAQLQETAQWGQEKDAGSRGSLAQCCTVVEEGFCDRETKLKERSFWEAVNVGLCSACCCQVEHVRIWRHSGVVQVRRLHTCAQRGPRPTRQWTRALSHTLQCCIAVRSTWCWDVRSG